MLNMPPVVVLIVCKVAFLPTTDINAEATGLENYEFVIEHGNMECRQEVVELMDPAYEQGADPQPYTKMACQRAGLTMGIAWNQGHKKENYRWLKSACPVPDKVDKDGNVESWRLPDCGHKDGVKLNCQIGLPI